MPLIRFEWTEGKEDKHIDLVAEGVPAPGDRVQIAIPTEGKPIIANKWVKYRAWTFRHDGPSITVYLKGLGE